MCIEKANTSDQQQIWKILLSLWESKVRAFSGEGEITVFVYENVIKMMQKQDILVVSYGLVAIVIFKSIIQLKLCVGMSKVTFQDMVVDIHPLFGCRNEVVQYMSTPYYN